MTVHEQVKRLYDYFYNKTYRSHFDLNLGNDLNRKMIDNFAKAVGAQLNLPNVGVNHLIDYFCYQFKYWGDKTTQREVSLNWIIGPKAFKRWKSRNKDVIYYVRKFVLEHDIDIDSLKRELSPEPPETTLNTAEELEKVRFTEGRLFHCLETTTLYHHRSATCLTCLERNLCKRMLKQKNLPLFTKRGYN